MRKETKILTIKEIQRYAKRKTVLIISILVVAILSILTACISFLLVGFNLIPYNLGLPASIIYIVTMLLAVVTISYYEKVRNKLIDNVTKDTLKIFFEYFNNETKKVFVYYEVKDIFMYGLWRLKDKNPYIKYISEIDDDEFDLTEAKGIIKKREILAASMFRCLTFRKNDYI